MKIWDLERGHTKNDMSSQGREVERKGYSSSSSSISFPFCNNSSSDVASGVTKGGGGKRAPAPGTKFL